MPCAEVVYDVSHDSAWNGLVAWFTKAAQDHGCISPSYTHELSGVRKQVHRRHIAHSIEFPTAEALTKHVTWLEATKKGRLVSTTL